MKQETIEEIAERLADKFRARFVRMTSDTEDLKVAIVEALRARDERAAKIATAHCANDVDCAGGEYCGESIAAAIKKGDR